MEAWLELLDSRPYLPLPPLEVTPEFDTAAATAAMADNELSELDEYEEEPFELTPPDCCTAAAAAAAATAARAAEVPFPGEPDPAPARLPLDECRLLMW